LIYCCTLSAIRIAYQNEWVALTEASYNQKELNIHNSFKSFHFLRATKCLGLANIILYMEGCRGKGNKSIFTIFFLLNILVDYYNPHRSTLKNQTNCRFIFYKTYEKKRNTLSVMVHIGTVFFSLFNTAVFCTYSFLPGHRPYYIFIIFLFNLIS